MYTHCVDLWFNHRHSYTVDQGQGEMNKGCDRGASNLVCHEIQILQN